jgi:hypothetical protein
LKTQNGSEWSRHLNRGEQIRMTTRKPIIFHVMIAAVLAMIFSSLAVAQNTKPRQDGPTGQVQQGLVGGTLVNTETREKLGLVTLSTGCSGSMLRDNWIITAAHCIDNRDPADSKRYINVAENSVTITANWKTVQRRQSMRIISFRPADVAIIRIAERFSGPIEGFNRQVYQGGLLSVKVTAYGRGINQVAQGSGAMATPTQQDGQYRQATFTTNKETNQEGDHLIWYPTVKGQMIFGGDSGGPSFTTGPDGDLLVGVHARCESICLPGKSCPDNDWTWISATPQAADAPIAPLWDTINGYLGAFVQTQQFIGTFGKTPAGYQPMWVYALKPNGELVWYRKENQAANWLGPRTVNTGWYFKDVIPAGGNAFFALTNDNKLMWYRHDGFNDGSAKWQGPIQVGNGWGFSKIFSGGEGIVYAVRDDGTLLWYRHNNYSNGGGGYASWSGPKVVGSGWASFKDVFSNGQGVIYAVKPDGKLVRYLHKGYATGDSVWSGPRSLGSGWQNYRQIMPVGSGVILAIKDDGQMVLYRYLDDEHSEGPIGPVANSRWEGPTPIGSGWVGFKKVVALIPASGPIVH